MNINKSASFMSSSSSGNQANQKTLGMTSAISLALPKPSDIQKTMELEVALRPHGVFESEQELNHRYVALILHLLFDPKL